MLLISSVAGGTGSGVGCLISEKIKDEVWFSFPFEMLEIFFSLFLFVVWYAQFPSVPMMNAVIWPYSTGEVVVQNYNACLTLSKLNQV